MPDVQTEIPVDVTALSVEDLTAAGVVFGGPLVMVEKSEHRAWRSHSEFLAKREDWDLLDRGDARSEAMRHRERRRATLAALISRLAGMRDRAKQAEQQGLATTAASVTAQADELAAEIAEIEQHPLRGLKLRRTFPCLGVLRIESTDSHGHRVVQCDKCGTRFGVGPVPEDGPVDDDDGYARF